VTRKFRLIRRRAVALALSVGVLAVGAPTAAAVTGEDFRSPDARDAAVVAHQSSVSSRDLRSPDARDATTEPTTGSQPASAPVPIETHTVLAVEERGSQTLSIVLSGLALAMALLALGIVAVARRPRPRWTAT
jgi:cytoskeletal protein RodZ